MGLRNSRIANKTSFLLNKPLYVLFFLIAEMAKKADERAS